MVTAAEIRHANLLRLVRFFGTTAELNRKLDRSERDATLAQIINRSANSKTGRPRQMGDRLARSIEEKFGWPRGRLDAPLEEPLFPRRVAERDSHYEAPLALTAQERDLVLSYRKLTDEMRDELLIDIMHLAEQHAQLTRGLMARMKVTGIVSPDRAAETLPPAPKTPRTARRRARTRS